MPQIIFLPNEDLCPDGAVVQAEKGESVLSVDQLARAASALNTAPSQICRVVENTISAMQDQKLKVSYDKPKRGKETSNTGLLLLGGAALAALIYAANKK